MTDAADDLTDWLAELRARLARGELDGQGAIAVSSGTLPVGLAARIMLADLDHTVRAARPRRDWGTWLLPVAALFPAVIAGTAALGQQLAASQVVASRPLEGTAPAGAATVLVRRPGDAGLQLQGLPDPPPGGVYQARLIAPNEPPAPAGAAPSGSATIPLGGDARGKTVATTAEPRPGARAPSSAPILAAEVPA